MRFEGSRVFGQILKISRGFKAWVCEDTLCRDMDLASVRALSKARNPNTFNARENSSTPHSCIRVFCDVKSPRRNAPNARLISVLRLQ